MGGSTVRAVVARVFVKGAGMRVRREYRSLAFAAFRPTARRHVDLMRVTSALCRIALSPVG